MSISGHVAGCGITEEVSQWMENIQNSAVEELPVPMSKDDAAKQHGKQLKKRTPAPAEAVTVEKKPSKSKTAHHHQPPKKYTSPDSRGASDDFKFPHQKYSKEANYREEELPPVQGHFYDPETGAKFAPTDENWHQKVHERMRRASGPGSRREDNKNTCSLYIQTDPLIWRHIREGIADVSIWNDSLKFR
mgnify:CR=1 FL=1